MQPYPPDPFRRDDERFARPEVLPPVGENEPARPYGWGPRPGAQAPPPPAQVPPGAVRRKRPYAPVTYGLVGLNVLVFVAMVFTGVSPMDPTSQQLIHWGAMNGDLAVNHGQWWRLLTSTFVHVGIIHLATNMWCLWNLGLLAEPLLGPMGLLATYVLTGMAGNVLGLPIHFRAVGAGASGAVFGIAGMLIILLGVATLPIPEAELKRLRRSVVYFAGINFLFGFSANFLQSAVQIENSAHLGGFLSGLAIGFPIAPRMMSGRVRYLRRQLIVFSGSAVLLAAVAYGMYVFIVNG